MLFSMELIQNLNNYTYISYIRTNLMVKNIFLDLVFEEMWFTLKRSVS